VASHRRERIETALWHGLCNMGIVSVRSSDGKSVRLSMLHVNGGMRTVCRFLSNAAHESISSSGQAWSAQSCRAAT
jgi:hypothetical protein